MSTTYVCVRNSSQQIQFKFLFENKFRERWRWTLWKLDLLLTMIQCNGDQFWVSEIITDRISFWFIELLRSDKIRWNMFPIEENWRTETVRMHKCSQRQAKWILLHILHSDPIIHSRILPTYLREVRSVSTFLPNSITVLFRSVN